MEATGQQDWRDSDETGRVRARFDFEFEPIHTDDETRTMMLRVKPHSKRYSLVMVEGKRHYLDRYLKNLIPEQEIERMIGTQSLGMPLIYNPPSIESASEYAAGRQQALNAEIEGENYVAPTEKSKPHGTLTEGHDRKFLTFLSVDICGSSALRRRASDDFERAYALLIRELATSVGHFHGSILKTTGDGFIAFIETEGYTTQCDNTVDLGLTFLAVLRGSINPALEKAGLPQLQIRIGADCGGATIRRLIVPTTGFENVEVGSDALNRAVKIEQTASSNELRIGRGLFELIHVQWLERCEEVEFNGTDVGIDGYQIYRVR